MALAARRAAGGAAAGFVDIAPGAGVAARAGRHADARRADRRPVMLVFESTVVTGHDEEYGAGRERDPARARGRRSRGHPDRARHRRDDRARRDGAGQPLLGRRREPRRRPAAGGPRGRDRLAREVERAARARGQGRSRRHGLAEAAAHACEEAALALLQARAVLNARATWRADDAQSSTAGADPARQPAAQRGRRHLRRRRLRLPAVAAPERHARRLVRHVRRGEHVPRRGARQEHAHGVRAHRQRPRLLQLHGADQRRADAAVDLGRGPLVERARYHEQRGLPRTLDRGRAVAGADIRPGRRRADPPQGLAARRTRSPTTS